MQKRFTNNFHKRVFANGEKNELENSGLEFIDLEKNASCEWDIKVKVERQCPIPRGILYFSTKGLRECMYVRGRIRTN